MSPEDILTQAIRRGIRTKIPGREIPIKQVEEQVSVPVKVVEKPEPPQMIAVGEPEPPLPKFPSVSVVIQTVADHYGISLADIVSSRRTKNVNIPRHVAMYLARTYTPQSFPAIGRLLGRRDHTTIMHGYKKIKSVIDGVDGDNKLRDEIAQIKVKLGLKDI